MGKFADAADQYTEAIFCKIKPEKKAVFYCNRSLASLKLEENQLALFDACEAVKLDPQNIKGYYRRGQAYVALRQMKMAVLDFKQCCKLQPANRDAREKYEVTLKAHKEQLLAQAIVYEEQKIEVDVSSIAVEAGYSGPRLESIDDVTAEWVVSLMEWQRERKVLHKKYATMIIQKATELFEPQDTLVDITIDELEEITVCGDVHGQYYDLMNIFKINGNPSEENPYLFNGDFIDRGSFSVEVIMLMLAWKVCFPQHFFMSRGNHEAKQLNKMYGFEGEVKAKYDVKTYDLFSQLFCHLPLCHVINRKVMVTHGGLFSKDGVKLAQIKNTHRKREPTDEGIMCECLWSDPCDMNGRHPSKRGVGVMFGPDVAERFLSDNNLSKCVASWLTEFSVCSAAGSQPRGEAGGLRVSKGRQGAHCVQRAQLLRPDGQQGRLCPLPRRRHDAQDYLLREGGPPQDPPYGLRVGLCQFLLKSCDSRAPAAAICISQIKLEEG